MLLFSIAYQNYNRLASAITMVFKKKSPLFDSFSVNA